MAIEFDFARAGQGQPGLHLAVQVIYHVRADASYLVARHDADPDIWIAVFTLEGRGILETPHRQLLTANTLMLVRSCDVQRYLTDPATGINTPPTWHFWWFEFRILTQAGQAAWPPWPLDKPIPVSRSLELGLCEQSLQAVKSGSPWLASTLLAALMSIWLQQRTALVRQTALFQQATRMIQERPGGLGLAELARQLDISERSLRNLFYSQAGCSPKHYQMKLKLELAAELLLITRQRIGEIADQLGFSSLYTFSRSFSRYFGVGPRQYRRHAGLPETASLDK